MAGHPLRPANHRCLGRPLPHQLANGTRAHPSVRLAPLSSPLPRGRRTYAVLATLSSGYPPPKGRLPTCYSPVRHFTGYPKVPVSFDLHVLSTPPAFVLSQDQTLQLKSSIPAASLSLLLVLKKDSKVFRLRPERLCRRTRTSLPAIQFSRSDFPVSRVRQSDTSRRPHRGRLLS